MSGWILELTVVKGLTANGSDFDIHFESPGHSIVKTILISFQ